MSFPAAVLFDLDGTILDHQHAAISGLHALHNALSNSIACPPSLPKWLSVEKEQFARYAAGEISYLEHRRQRLRGYFAPCYGVTQPDEELDQLYELYLTSYEQGWRCYPEVHQVLASLAPIPCALVTNGSSILQRKKITALGIEQYFKVILISEEFGSAKPAPDIFLRACNLLGILSPANALYVGDNFDADVIGSAAAGLRPYWLNRDRISNPKSSLSYQEIHDLCSLMELSS